MPSTDPLVPAEPLGTADPAGYPRRASAAGCPVVVDLPGGFSMPEAFAALRARPGVLWLDSAQVDVAQVDVAQVDLAQVDRVGHDSRGRYSFLTADPIRRLVAGDGDDDPFPKLAAACASLPENLRDDLPPFQGGWAGLFGYELGRDLEPIGATRWNDLPTPRLALGLYDWVIAHDAVQDRAWLISQGLGETDPQRRRAAAERRAARVQGWLEAGPQPPRADSTPPRAATALAPQYPIAALAGGDGPVGGHGTLTCNFPPGGYREAVDQIVRAIARGDCFQVNLAQRLLCRAELPAAELYLRLRAANPAPQAGFFDGGSFQVLSSSPESFLRVRQREVQTRPIKGTCRRTGDARRDARLAAELAGSEKERAENVMIVDLMRNDLSRVCTDDSVRVDRLCAIERYAYVQHLVSVVSGRLRDEASVVDLLRACFPGGSVTGAPKVEAMRKIAQWEPTPRGPYCGSLGYIGCGGTADLNILIRTVTQTRGWLQIPVGGGITARSIAEREEAETWEKAEGMLRAIGGLSEAKQR